MHHQFNDSIGIDQVKVWRPTTHQMEQVVPKTLFFLLWFPRARSIYRTVRTFNKPLFKTIFSISTLSLLPFLSYKSLHTVRSLLTSHPEQFISFAFSSKEPSITTSSSCFLNACHINFSIRQCLYYFTCSTCQWVNIPGTDPISLAFLQFISPQVLMNADPLP